MRNLIIWILPLLLLAFLLHAKNTSSFSGDGKDIEGESVSEAEEELEEKLKEEFKNLKYDKITDDEKMEPPKIEKIEPSRRKKPKTEDAHAEEYAGDDETKHDNLEHKRKKKKGSAAVSKKKQEREKLKAKKLIKKKEVTRVSKSVEEIEKNRRLKFLKVEGSDFKKYPKWAMMDIDVSDAGFYHCVGWDQFLVNKTDEKYFTTYAYWFKNGLDYFKLRNQVNMTTKWDPRNNILNISWANWSHDLGLLHIKFKNREESSLEIFKENLVFRPDPEGFTISKDFPFDQQAAE